MIRYFADECVARLIITGLQSRGHNVAAASDLCRGDSDDRALALATAAGRVVITDDRGFGELAVRQKQPALGVIVLLLHQFPTGTREAYAVDRISELGERAAGQLTIIEPGKMWIRQLPIFP